MAFMCQRTGVFYAFTFLVSLVTIFGILTWISILVSHIFFVRARKAQEEGAPAVEAALHRLDGLERDISAIRGFQRGNESCSRQNSHESCRKP